MTYAGVDPIYDPIPVRPGAHYHMGGVKTDEWGATELTGLFAAGECACISVHGSNRLGGNSLMETVTFGRRSGKAAAELGDVPHRRSRSRSRPSVTPSERCRRFSTAPTGERPYAIRDELGASMLENFGVFRREAGMLRQTEVIAGLRERYDSVLVEDKGAVFNSDLDQAIELGCMLDLASCMLEGGLARKESRGAHSRPYDFPTRDDENFLKHSITRWVDGSPSSATSRFA